MVKEERWLDWEVKVGYSGRKNRVGEVNDSWVGLNGLGVKVVDGGVLIR